MAAFFHCISGCAALQHTKNPLESAISAKEGAIFLSITHAGGFVGNWSILVVERIEDGRAAGEYILPSMILRDKSNTTLFSGALRQGMYRLKRLSTFSGAGMIDFNLGDDLNELQFYAKENSVNDLGRLVVAGPFTGTSVMEKSFAIQLTKNFVPNTAYIERYSPGFFVGKTIINSPWTGKETAYGYSSGYGKVFANGYDALAIDEAGVLYVGNRMGSVLRIYEDRKDGTADIGVFDSGSIDTVRSLLLLDDEVVVGGDMPALSVVDLTTKSITPLSVNGLQNGSVEHLHRGSKNDLYAVVCSKEKLVLEYCSDRSSCQWSVVKAFSRKKFLGMASDASVCGGASYKRNILVYLTDDHDRSIVSIFDLAAQSWQERELPITPASVHIDYDERIVAMRGAASMTIGQPRFIVSDDGGIAWREIFAPSIAMPLSAPVFVDGRTGYWALNNASPSEILSLSRNYALMKTIDGGRTWTVLNSKFPNVYQLFSSSRSNRVYAKTIDELGRSALVSIDMAGKAITLVNDKPKIKSVKSKSVK
jgi:hypothetical protein